MKINFNNKTFTLIENSDKGAVTSETKFFFKQEEDLITADYHGGEILYGKIIGLIKDDKLLLSYHCVTKNKIIKAGKASGDITFDSNEKIKFLLNWRWIDETDNQSGTSTYLEL